jgi:site-specific recombinase XerD
MIIIDVVTAFLMHVKLHHSIGNHNYYKSHLMHFVRWCDRNNLSGIDEVNNDVLVDYISDLR